MPGVEPDTVTLYTNDSLQVCTQINDLGYQFAFQLSPSCPSSTKVTAMLNNIAIFSTDSITVTIQVIRILELHGHGSFKRPKDVLTKGEEV